MLSYLQSLLARQCFLDIGKILELGRRARCNFHKHVLSCPSGFAHVQSPNARIIPAASPISFSSVLHQGFSLRHISSVRRRGEPPRRGLWRTPPAGPDGRALRWWTTHTEMVKCAVCTSPLLSLSRHILLIFFFLVIKQKIGNVTSNCCLMDVELSAVAERYSSLYGCVQVISRGYWGPYESAFVITWSWEQWPGSFLWC